MKISVVMATYNGGPFIGEQLKSLALQSRLPDELIITDDGSSDDTASVVHNFRENARFDVQFHVNEEQLGYNLNFEKALSLAQGDIIFISDQDDYWHSKKIELICDIFDRFPQYQVILNDQEICDKNLLPSGITVLGNIKHYRGNDYDFVAGCCTALRQQWRNFALPLPKCVIPYDSWISELAQRLGVRYIYAHPLQLYRRHGANISRSIYSRPSRRLMHPDFSAVLRREMPHRLDRAREICEAYCMRIKKADTDCLYFEGAMPMSSALKYAQEELIFIDKRKGIIPMSFWIRIYSILNLWIRGEYSYASGILSVAKDLLFLKK